MPTTYDAASYERAVRLYKTKLRPVLTARIAHFEPLLPAGHIRITRVCVRAQKTRWGSCSSTGTLSFNWKLYLAPPEILDYVVVHELCHLSEMNHSKRFWALVESILPDYKSCEKWLKENGRTLDLPHT